MKILIENNYSNFRFFFDVNEDDTVGDLKEKIIKKTIKEIPHSTHNFYLSLYV